MPRDDAREVLFEITRIGAYMKVVAIDPVTGIEVTVQGPKTALQKDLQQLATKKLKLAIEREKQR